MLIDIAKITHAILFRITVFGSCATAYVCKSIAFALSAIKTLHPV